MSCQFLTRKCLEWDSYLSQSDVPKDALIAKSVDSSENISSLPTTKHSFAASLHFIQEVSAGSAVAEIAKQFINGVDDSIATRTQEIVNSTFEELVEPIQEEKITLHCPVDKIYSHLESLPDGEYLIPLKNHVVSVIKNKDGLFLFDSNKGTIKLEFAQKWFTTYLKNYGVYTKLDVLKIGTKSSNESEIFDDECPTIQKILNQSSRWSTVNVTFRGKTFKFTWDQKADKIYNDDSHLLIRLKCIGLLIKTPIDAVVRTIYHLFVCVIRPNKYSFADIFRAPIFGLACMATACYGILDPLNGRRLYNFFERALNCQVNNLDLNAKYYSAPCFNPLSEELIKKIVVSRMI